MRSRLLGVAAATLVEGPAVYVWLRLDHAEKSWWVGIACLFAGEFLETLAVGRMLRSTVSPVPVGDPDGALPYRRRVARRFLVASLAEVGIWVLWLYLAHHVGQLPAAVVLLVLMHFKHQLETVTVCDTPYAVGLFAFKGTLASAFETGGAVASFALIRDGEPALAAPALAAGLLIEHFLLVDRLFDEISERDISVPRLKPPPVPFLLRLLAYFGKRFAPVWRRAEGIRTVQRFLNRRAIDELVSQMPPRPNAFSTISDYTSWRSLTDRKYSGRHLQATKAGPPAYPDVDAVAALFMRGPEMTPCPKSTVLFACFAQWFTDGFLRTERDGVRGPLRDTRRNESTHDVDLAQLYGLDAAMTDLLRAKHGGLLVTQVIDGEEYPEHLCRCGCIRPRFKGLIRPFGFDDLTREQRDRLFAMGTDTRNLGFIAFNVLFLREHNRIARALAVAHPQWDDERLFQTTRNILIVVLIRIVIEEYINHITSFWFRFRFPPSGSVGKQPWMRPNWMAIEFNLLYRWHSLMPPTITVGGQVMTIQESLSKTEILTAAGLRAFMVEVSEQPAGRIGLFNTDPFLVAVAEKPSIGQGRLARLRSYNDYRELCRLPRLGSFCEFSTDPRIHDRLRALYDRVDDVEFYVGLFAEEPGRYEMLPPLMTTMVAFDAFSQVLTNSLLAPGIYTAESFSRTGMEIIGETNAIAQLVARNVPMWSPGDRVSLTQREYRGP